LTAKAKAVVSNFPDEVISDVYNQAEQSGVIEPGKANEILNDIQKYREAEASVPETVTNTDARDAIAGKLIGEKKIQKCIIVGIWNNDKKRNPEYFPQKVYPSFSVEQKKFISEDLIKRKKIDTEFNPISDSYLKFIVEELKPYIDKTYSTYKDRKHTFISGSSMGGLISLYAICEYPKVFGGAACLSTHWTGIYQNNDNPIPDAMISYLKKNLPNPKNHKIYFDYGDQTLDSLYRPWQEKLDVVMKAKGFTSKNWKTQFFAGKDHSEQSWRERFFIPLEFLLRF
jgi:enterochelin esterase-like enzyme